MVLMESICLAVTTITNAFYVLSHDDLQDETNILVCLYFLAKCDETEDYVDRAKNLLSSIKAVLSLLERAESASHDGLRCVGPNCPNPLEVVLKSACGDANYYCKECFVGPKTCINKACPWRGIMFHQVFADKKIKSMIQATSSPQHGSDSPTDQDFVYADKSIILDPLTNLLESKKTTELELPQCLQKAIHSVTNSFMASRNIDVADEDAYAVIWTGTCRRAQTFVRRKILLTNIVKSVKFFVEKVVEIEED